MQTTANYFDPDLIIDENTKIVDDRTLSRNILFFYFIVMIIFFSHVCLQYCCKGMGKKN